MFVNPSATPTPSSVADKKALVELFAAGLDDSAAHEEFLDSLCREYLRPDLHLTPSVGALEQASQLLKLIERAPWAGPILHRVVLDRREHPDLAESSALFRACLDLIHRVLSDQEFLPPPRMGERMLHLGGALEAMTPQGRPSPVESVLREEGLLNGEPLKPAPGPTFKKSPIP